MLYWLVDANRGLDDTPLRLLTAPEFQGLVALLGAFALVLALGRPTISWLRRKKVGDAGDFDDAAMNATMKSKAGTPTMGGLLVVGAILGVAVLLADLRDFYVQLGLLCVAWLAAVGAVDDWLKLTAARRQDKSRGRQGLTGRQKLALQIGLALLIGGLAYWHGQDMEKSATTLFVPFFKTVAVSLPAWAFITLAVLTIVGSSNAVNLTDGLDGLAAGCMAIVGLVFLVFTLVLSDADLATSLLYKPVAHAGQMAVFCGGVVGACLGFLWFNCHPARVFMGDTGSLALGGLIGYVALVTRQELALVIVGGVFVAEALSVMLQVGYFKYTRRRYGAGRRIFLMSPLHHHFQKKGWGETQVVVRFWLIGAVLAAVTLATVKLR